MPHSCRTRRSIGDRETLCAAAARIPSGDSGSPEPPLVRVDACPVLVPGSTRGAVWSGPDRDSPFLAQAQAVLGGEGTAGLDEQSGADLSRAVNDPYATVQALEIPPGVPFHQPEQTVITWDVALNAQELIGLLGTFTTSSSGRTTPAPASTRRPAGSCATRSGWRVR